MNKCFVTYYEKGWENYHGERKNADLELSTDLKCVPPKEFGWFGIARFRQGTVKFEDGSSLMVTIWDGRKKK